MTVRDVVEQLELRVVAGESGLGKEVSGGYAGDLLSCVMAKAAKGSLWVTIQGHPNTVAVATLVGMSAILVAEGSKIDPGTVEKANQEEIPLLSSPKSVYSLVSDLVGVGCEKQLVVTPYVADLYLHTAFSPCAGCRMVPKLILESGGRNRSLWHLHGRGKWGRKGRERGTELCENSRNTSRT